MRFADPAYLGLFALVIGVIWHQLRSQRRLTALPLPSVQLARSLGRSRVGFLRHGGLVCRVAAMSALVLALARPQDGHSRTKRSTEGLDIVLVTDTSRSMEARDFVLHGERPTRLTVIKDVMASFIAERVDDRIGLVIFGTEAFTQAPLTLDHDLLLSFLDRVRIGMAGDATAIGDGLATAVSRLKDIEAKSRVVILLTDGGNTAGRIDPLAAAEAAKALDVKVYTIGVGSKGEVPVSQGGATRVMRTDVDVALLKQIAESTGGRHFLATDTEALRKVYQTIDELEKTKVELERFDNYEEHYGGFAAMALGFVLCELLFGLSRFRRIP